MRLQIAFQKLGCIILMVTLSSNSCDKFRKSTSASCFKTSKCQSEKSSNLDNTTSTSLKNKSEPKKTTNLLVKDKVSIKKDEIDKHDTNSLSAPKNIETKHTSNSDSGLPKKQNQACNKDQKNRVSKVFGRVNTELVKAKRSLLQGAVFLKKTFSKKGKK